MGVKRPGRGCDPPPHLALSGPSWPVVGRTVPLQSYPRVVCCNFRWMIVLTTDNAYCGGRQQVKGSCNCTCELIWSSSTAISYFRRLYVIDYWPLES